ncbi:DUF397 domain-containing protein [Streptomyces somaliensis]|uniref:DUF397 domain-containing protein n=1 Tax=Streptomyces somaliensis TaxID=78355 RepID=UPI0020CD18EF|nr:DUF397 domain-containing protein [Streptomyces somaliensis]MCP9946697.1 DUF397 domain-containing protein [Streptomyces somaliensis]MCP9963725.1 DUF397 domain-containing protein [Streptomyces somaliensis]MCP9972934.1 DUF397 domain-containing protein [Streptomyces somaliensis]
MSGEEDGLSPDGLIWFKSSYSAGDGGECVEVAACSGRVHVRDSKDTARAPLAVDAPAWAAFVEFAAL